MVDIVEYSVVELAPDMLGLGLHSLHFSHKNLGLSVYGTYPPNFLSVLDTLHIKTLPPEIARIIPLNIMMMKYRIKKFLKNLAIRTPAGYIKKFKTHYLEIFYWNSLLSIFFIKFLSWILILLIIPLPTLILPKILKLIKHLFLCSS